MKLVKNKDTKNAIEEENNLPIYDVEIITEPQEEVKIVPAGAKPPEKKLAFRLGKAAGTIIAALGFYNEIRHKFKTGNIGGSGMGRGMGKGKRRRKGKTRRII